MAPRTGLEQSNVREYTWAFAILFGFQWPFLNKRELPVMVRAGTLFRTVPETCSPFSFPKYKETRKRCFPYTWAPLAQLVEQLTLNQWVQGSSPWRCTIYSSIAQSVERMTVNHDVTGSSPVRGAKNPSLRAWIFLFAPRTELGPATSWLVLCSAGWA